MGPLNTEPTVGRLWGVDRNSHHMLPRASMSAESRRATIGEFGNESAIYEIVVAFSE